VRIAPEYPVAHVNLGSTYLDLGDYDRAETAFRDALHLDPDHATAYYNLGLLTLRQARHAESRTFLQNAISRNPGYAKAYRALGTLEMAAGRPEAAAAALKKAVALNPGDATTYAEIGRLAQRAGSPEMAEAYYREALRHDPSNSDVLNALGVLYLDHRRLGDALDQFAAALQTDPGYLEAAYNRAVTLFRLGRREEAREAAERLLPQIPAGQQYESFRRTAQAILGNGPKQGLEQNSPGTTGPPDANP
jgi:tetratricopeptide (TPR) repeat protein